MRAHGHVRVENASPPHPKCKPVYLGPEPPRECVFWIDYYVKNDERYSPDVMPEVRVSVRRPVGHHSYTQEMYVATGWKRIGKERT